MTKYRGKVFTPDYLVSIILNQGNYVLGNINKKHVIDNSCGDGQFMVQIVDRYCKDFLSRSADLRQLKKELEIYIHAIEIEEEELAICRKRCEEAANSYGVYNICWHFICEDALSVNEFDRKIDFVIGNPPYVRVHNLQRRLKFSFCNNGMTDIYLAFYELGIRMLNENGVLAYITPSSFFTSVAGYNLRKYLVQHNLLESVCDLKHFQAFNKHSVYTAIICLNQLKKGNSVKYYEFDKERLTPCFIANIVDYNIQDKFYFAKGLDLLKAIINNNAEVDIEVKNGFATLADDIFIAPFKFKSKYLIPIYKASKGIYKYAIYPYDKNGTIVTEEELSKDSNIYPYLLLNKHDLKLRALERNSVWYAFGRSQAIKDTYKNKLAINTMIRSLADLKIETIPSGCGVYGGLYITSAAIDLDLIKNALLQEEFLEYVKLLGKYKSGKYYTFSSKDVKKYLQFMLQKKHISIKKLQVCKNNI